MSSKVTACSLIKLLLILRHTSSGKARANRSTYGNPNSDSHCDVIERDAQRSSNAGSERNAKADSGGIRFLVSLMPALLVRRRSLFRR